MEKEELVKKIVDVEWGMFQAVENIGGRAACQDDKSTFYILRSSQFLAWDIPALQNYYGDLAHAQSRGDNLAALKYAYMMRETDPEEYEKFKERLPAVPEINMEIIEALIPIHLLWTKEMYDATGGGTRELTSDENTAEGTSYETYLRGELMTYSLKTLQAYENLVNVMVKHGRNLSLEIAKNQMQLVGEY